MFSYFWRGVGAVVAIIYASVAIGLSYFSTTEPPEATVSFSLDEVHTGTGKSIVHVLQNGEESSFKLQQALDLYSIELPENIRFSIQTVAGTSEYRSTLRSKLLSGDSVDLFQISGAREYFELEKHIRELGTLSWLSQACPGTLDAVSYNGQIFGVPYSIEGFGFICNRDIFEAADIPISEILTPDDLYEAFISLNNKILSGELDEDFVALEAVCEFPVHDKAFLSTGFADIAMSGAFNSLAEAALSPTIHFPASEPVETLVKRLADFSMSGNEWKKLAEVTNSQQIERFAHGRVAVILQDTNVYRFINEINPKLKGRAFLLPVPLDTFEEASIYTGVPKYWAINSASDPKTAEAAGGFLTWLYRSEEGTEFFASEFEEVSPFRDTAKSTGAALHSQMLGYLDAGMTLPRFHREFPGNWGKDVFASNVQSYFTDTSKTWSDILAACEEGWPLETALTKQE